MGAVMPISRPPTMVPSKMARRCWIDQCIAADQLFRAQVLGQDGVLERTEQRGVRAHQEEGAQQAGQAELPEADGGQRGDEGFEQFHPADQAGFFELVGQLSGAGREQEKRQDEQACTGIDQNAGVEEPLSSLPRKAIRITMAFFITLSLNAPRNWVRKRAQTCFAQQAELVGHEIRPEGDAATVTQSPGNAPRQDDLLPP